MATPYSDVYDLFMQNIKDYNLIALYSTSVTDFEEVLQGWLIFSIQYFSSTCDQDLTDRNDSTNTFLFDLSEENKVYLATFMVGFWFEKETQDVLQVNLTLQDRDFKRFAEANNLNSKERYLTAIQEKYAQMLVDYQFERVDWSAWGDGDYGV